MTLQVTSLEVRWMFLKNYVYIISDATSGAALIVDPSWQKSFIERAIKAQGYRLMGILLTHSHFDHVHLAGRMSRKYAVPVWMSGIEIDYYRFDCPNLQRLKDGELIPFGDDKVKSILTPGHTKGSMCYLIGEHLFTGDTLFNAGIGICTKKGGDPEGLFYSLQRLKGQIPPETKIYPGHAYGEKSGVSFAALKRRNIYLNLNRKKDFIAFRTRKGQRCLLRFT